MEVYLLKMASSCGCTNDNPKNVVINNVRSDISGVVQPPVLISAFDLRKRVENSRDAMTTDEFCRCSAIICEFEKMLLEGKQVGYFQVAVTDKMKKNMLKLGYWCGTEVKPDGQERGWVTFA